MHRLFRKRGPKHAQITMFVIVGIIILFVLAFAIYLTTIGINKPPVISVDTQPTDKRLCLEKASELAVQTIALYGGLQGPQLQVANSQVVRIGVAASDPVVDPAAFVLGRTQLGRLQFNPLCLRSGPNRPNAEADGTNSCQQGTYQIGEPDDQVLQAAFATIVQQQTAACELSGPVQVTFGLSDIKVQQQEVSVNLPVRFKRVYNAARVLAMHEVKELLYDKRARTSVQWCEEPANFNECLFTGMTLTTRTIPDAGGATLVQLTDTKSSVLSDPFVWRFVIENRPPMVYQYPKVPVAAPLGEATVLSSGILSADPDEQSLAITCEPAALLSCDTVGAGVTNTTTVTLHPDCDDYAAGQQVPARIIADDGSLKTVATVTVSIEGSC